ISTAGNSIGPGGFLRVKPMTDNLPVGWADAMRYADALSACFSRLGFVRDDHALPDGCVITAARVSLSEVCDLYVLD
ncbi:hypothetical protein QN403_28430, partial [Pseudomonas sp. RTS2]|nr:hypothetical protein [Pseudomonas sp. RTS2]